MGDIKTLLIKQIENAGKYYVSDLKSLTDEQLNAAQGSARKAADFTYEVAVVNQRVAARLRGEDPGPWTGEGWMTAPAEMANQDSLIEAIELSIKAVVDALAALPDEHLTNTLQLGENKTSLFELATMALVHTSYHDAQLNYLQSLHGDTEVHWV